MPARPTRQCRQKIFKKLSNETHKTICNFAKNSVIDTNESIKVGDIIRSEWTIKRRTFWWRAQVIKIKNIAYQFGKPCRRYLLRYEPEKFYSRGKLMEHCFFDECRLFDVKEQQLVSYYKEEESSSDSD